MLFVIHPSALVVRIVGMVVLDTLPMLQVILEITLIAIAIFKFVSSLPIFYLVFELSDVGLTIRVLVLA